MLPEILGVLLFLAALTFSCAVLYEGFVVFVVALFVCFVGVCVVDASVIAIFSFGAVFVAVLVRIFFVFLVCLKFCSISC